jgi:hypothetical protein
MPAAASVLPAARSDASANAAAVATAAVLAEERPKRKYTKTKTALEHLVARGSISIDQLRAGDRLATDYRISMTNPNRLTDATCTVIPTRISRSSNLVNDDWLIGR